jgi:hypothetical protein
VGKNQPKKSGELIFQGANSCYWSIKVRFCNFLEHGPMADCPYENKLRINWTISAPLAGLKM